MKNTETRILINMFKCECYPNHEICKNKNTCEFRIPLNPVLLQIYRQLKYELSKLNTLKQRKQDYHHIAYEIQNHMYSEKININGEFQLVPKMNVLGNHITKPEHVQVGLNYNDIIFDIQDQESIIRELRRKEHTLLMIMKKL